MLRGPVESRNAAGRTDDPPAPQFYGASYPAELIPFLN